MKTIKIARLRPTQIPHGERQIREKTRAYRSLSRHELEMAIAEKPGPIVLGPANAPYAIDHHHVATALWHVSVTRVPVVLIRDLSSLTRGEFWVTRENHRWTYPYDRDGEGWRLQTCTSTCGSRRATNSAASLHPRATAADTKRRPCRLKSSGGRISSGIACRHPRPTEISNCSSGRRSSSQEAGPACQATSERLTDLTTNPRHRAPSSVWVSQVLEARQTCQPPAEPGRPGELHGLDDSDIWGRARA